MATSSITHNFVISDPESVERFIQALDEADKDRTPPRKEPISRELTDPDEIMAVTRRLLKKQRENQKNV